MTKKELADKVSAATGFHWKEVTAMLDSATDEIVKAVADGDIVTLKGFGKFIPVQRKAKRGQHINQHKTLDIPAQTVPKFVPYDDFKNYVKDKNDGN